MLLGFLIKLFFEKAFNQTIVFYVRKNEEQKPKEQRFKANENKPVMTE